MGRDDIFRRTFEAGMSFLDMSRERAEALVKDLVKAGEVQKGKTQKVIDDLLERSRKSSEELRQLVRREIAQQIGAMGLATKDDISRIEARLADVAATAPAAPAPAPPPPEAPEAATPAPSPAPVTDAPPPPSDAPAKAAPIKRGTSKKSAAKKGAASASASVGNANASAAAKVAPLKKAGPARKKPAPPAGEE